MRDDMVSIYVERFNNLLEDFKRDMYNEINLSYREGFDEGYNQGEEDAEERQRDE